MNDDPHVAAFRAKLKEVMDTATFAIDTLGDLVDYQARDPNNWDDDAAHTSHEDLTQAPRVAREHLLTAYLWLERATGFRPLGPDGTPRA